MIGIAHRAWGIRKSVNATNSKEDPMNQLIGICLIIVSAVSFGTMAIFAVFASATGVTVESMLFLRFGIAAAMMLPIALLQRRRFPNGRDLLTLIAMGVFGYAGMSFCYFTALTIIPPSLVAALLYLYPVFVAVLSVLFLNETFTRNRLTALGLAVSGAVLVIGVEFTGHIRGILLGITAAVIYSVYTIVGASVMQRNDAFTSSFVIIASAGTFYLLYSLGSGFFIPPTPGSWLNIIAIAVISTAMAIYAYFQGMKYTGAVNAAMLSTFEPVTTMVLTSWVLGVHISPSQMAGAALIILSAIVIVMRTRRISASVQKN